MKPLFYKVFNVNREEGKHIFLLFTFSFCFGIAYAFLYTTATSLLLSNFNTSILPYAYMGGGLLSYLLWFVYHRFEKKFVFSRLSIYSSLFLLVSLTFLSLGYYFTESKTFSFLLFVWIYIFIFITMVGFWGIASRIFDLRQGKRLFGLVGSGEILSKTLSFFAIPFILNWLETKQLLFFIVIGYAISITVLLVIMRRYRHLLSVAIATNTKNKKPKEKKNKRNLSSFLQNKYFAYILILAIFPLFAAYYVDFIFLGLTKANFSSEDLVSSFLSLFFGIMAVSEFILKTFISGRLMEKYGMILGILALPAVLLLSTVIGSSFGLIYGATGIFFSFIILSKLLVRVFRTSFLDPSFQVLYQPIPSNERLAFQSKVEGIPKPLGNIIVGLTLIVFTSISALNVVHYNIILIGIVLLWLWLSYKLFLEYRKKLKSIINTGEENEILTIEEKSNLFTLYQHLENTPKPNFNLYFNLISKVEPRHLNAFLKRALIITSGECQQKALQQIKQKRVVSAKRIVEDYLHTHENVSNKTAFQETAKILVESRKVNIDALTALANSDNPGERIIAANLLAYSGRYHTFKLLVELMKDENPAIRKTAIISSGSIGRAELWQHIINNLFVEAYANTAVSAIKMIGDPIIPELGKTFNKFSTPNHVKLKIISIISAIKGEMSIEFLRLLIQNPDEEIKHRALLGLSKMNYQAKPWEESLVKSAIEDEIGMIVWAMSAINDMQEDSRSVYLVEALQYELNQCKENVFLLLSMIYDPKTILYIRETLEKGVQETKVFAVEILDLTVSTEIKELLLPLIDSSSIERTLKQYANIFPQVRMNLFERLRDIINKDYLKINTWTKACAMDILRDFTNSENLMLANMLNPEPFIMQIALSFLESKKAKRYETMLSKISKEQKAFINEYRPSNNGYQNHWLLIDKVKVLKDKLLFRSLPMVSLAWIIEKSKDIILENDEVYTLSTLEMESIFYVNKGKAQILVNNHFNREIHEGEVFWGIIINLENKLSFRAEEKCMIMKLSPGTIYENMTENYKYTKEVITLLGEST